jgi:diguanylate cyclase (GGDEF)-like protein/PAS domain S-box-containing protein
MFALGSALKILLIEDNLAEARLLGELLKDVDQPFMELIHAQRLQMGLHRLATEKFDVILLDLTLPDSHGIASIKAVANAAPHLPLIVLTNLDDSELALLALRQGAQDYLVKRQVNQDALVRALRYAIERKGILDALNQARNELEQRVEERTAQLAKAEKLAQVTLESISDAVITTNTEGQIEGLNSAAEQLMGYSLDQAKGQPLKSVLRLFDEETGAPVPDLVEQALHKDSQPKTLSLLLLNPRNSREIAVELSVAPIYLEQGQAKGVVLVCRDVTPTRNLARQLSWHAAHDSLTGLINRREFEHLLSAAVQDAKISGATHLLCYLDLDQFKIVNDTCGHSAGDELLRQVSYELQTQIRKKDLLARLGGDEFGVLLYDCSLADGQQIAHKITQALSHYQFIWQDKIFRITVSIGLVEIDVSVNHSDEILSAADAAMYVAKDQGGNRSHAYCEDDRELAKRLGDMQWVSQIRSALEENQFCLFCQEIQPIQPTLANQSIYEILLRLRDKSGLLITPNAFIPAAERYHLMPHLDRWVVRTLFETLSHDRDSTKLSYLIQQPLYNVNLSGASFNDPSFLAFLKEQFLIYQICPSSICFEITETAAITHLKKAVEFIEELKQLGCRFALDDFGRGMSSLTYLKTLPVDYLKIDGQLVKPIVNDPVAVAMLEAISHISSAMGLRTIAEFVENDLILQKVQALGIDYVQGYAVGKPYLFQQQPLGCYPLPVTHRLAS